MKHKLAISFSREADQVGIMQCKKVTVREKLLTMLLGRKQKVMILLPADSVSSVAITEIAEGGVGA